MTDLPDADRIIAWIRDNPGRASSREIARAFGLKGRARTELRALLRALAEAGRIPPRGRKGRRVRHAGGLPPVAVLRITGPDDQGDLWAEPGEWPERGEPPRVLVVDPGRGPALGTGDRVLARIAEEPSPDATTPGRTVLTARVIRRIGRIPRKVLGVFRATAEGGRIVPIEKGASTEWLVGKAETGGAQDGELVEAEPAGKRSRLGLPRARVVEVLGDPGAPRSVSLIAIHAHGIPDTFPDEALAEAEAAAEPGPEGRVDLRDLAFVTIDPADARDHDDAVFAQADDDPANPGGFILWVAIADVAAFVRPGSALDAEARRRGNSTYFPDRVVPMLPDRLSGDLCSLHEGVDRAVIAVRMVIDAEGRKKRHAFKHAVIRSRASLAYEAVQAAIDGNPDETTAPLLEPVLAPLWGAWRALMRARARRQPLDLDLPERKIVLDEQGNVVSVAFRERLDAHRVIEEAMILANVAAAETLERRRTPLLYRVHEEPAPEKIDALREFAESLGLSLPRGQVLTTRALNRLLHAARASENAEAVNIAVLRAMTQAYYSPENYGHFGLALPRYAHFTSPIRRYADLIVHRGLIAAHRWGADGLAEADVARLEETASLISETERRSMAAERDTNDRYLAAFLRDRVGAEFSGRITGVARFGVFVRLDETGAEGLVPVATLGREYFVYDEASQTLRGDRSGLELSIAQRVTVRLAEAVPATGGLIFELIEAEGTVAAPKPGRRGKARGPVRRKANAARARRRKGSAGRRG